MKEDLPPEERYKGWGRRWQEPPMSYQEYVVIEISQGAFGDGKRRYILVDGDHYSTACTFSTAPQGPLFTVEELKQRLEGWKYVGIEKNLIEEKLEQAFRHGREPIAS